MAKLLFRLNGVPDDEADDVRELLVEHGYDCYETDAGRWRISVAAIWLKDERQYDAARQLIDTYQQQRQQKALQEQAELQQQGQVPTLWYRFWQNPLQFLALLLALLFVLGISVVPFVNWLI